MTALFVSANPNEELWGGGLFVPKLEFFIMKQNVKMNRGKTV